VPPSGPSTDTGRPAGQPAADEQPIPSAARRSPRLIALACLLGAVVLWGTSFAATKEALQSFTPMTVVWLRMAAATIAFAPFWRRLPRPDYRRGDWKVLSLTGLLMPCLYYLCENYALNYTTSSQAGVITAVTPLLVAAGAWLFLRERLRIRPMIAIAVSLAGVAALSLGGSLTAASNPVLGNTLELLAMICAAGWMLLTRHLAGRYSPWLITGAQAAVGVVFFLPGALVSGPATWAAAPPLAWASVAYLGLLVSIGAFGLYNTALTMMPANRASLAINMIPAVALVTGWLALGESLTLVQIVACVAILGAVAFGESGRENGTGRATEERSK